MGHEERSRGICGSFLCPSSALRAYSCHVVVPHPATGLRCRGGKGWEPTNPTNAHLSAQKADVRDRRPRAPVAKTANLSLRAARGFVKRRNELDAEDVIVAFRTRTVVLELVSHFQKLKPVRPIPGCRLECIGPSGGVGARKRVAAGNKPART